MTQKLTLSAVFLALGVLFPIVFHAMGSGSLFLPMFWPVSAAGFFLPLFFTLLVGSLTPVVSFLMTGMPPIAPPILQVMFFELTVLAAMVHLLYHRVRLPILASLFLGLLASRAVLFFSAGLLGRALGLPAQWASAAALLRSFPGVIAILILVPPMVGCLLHESVFRPGRPHD